MTRVANSGTNTRDSRLTHVFRPRRRPASRNSSSAVQHVEVHNSRRRQPGFARQPGKFGGRIAVGVVGKESVRVEIHGGPGSGSGNQPVPGLPPESGQRLAALGGIETIELLFQ